VELTMTDAVENPQDYDVIIIDSLPPPARLTGNIITIGTALPDGAFTPTEPLPVEREISVVPHEITEDLGFTGLQVEEAISGALVPRAQPLIRAGDRTLMFAYRGPNLNQVGFLFRLRDSDLPLKASFPVLMRNILAWLAPTGTAGEVGYHRAGDTVPLYVPPGESVVVTLPDGTPERFTPRVSPFEFSQTEQVGVYSVIGESFTSRFAVSLASGEESDLSPSQTPSRAALDESGTTGTGQETSGTDIWHWLALAATLALTIDWLIWARRT
jgi:hypothetical protein